MELIRVHCRSWEGVFRGINNFLVSLGWPVINNNGVQRFKKYLRRLRMEKSKYVDTSQQIVVIGVAAGV